MMRSPPKCGAACARAHNFQRHFLWLNIKKRTVPRTLFLTISSGVFFMPGHNFILLALRGNLLDFRGIKRQFLQLTRDDFSSTCSVFFILVCFFTIFHWEQRRRWPFFVAHKADSVMFIKFLRASSLDKKLKLISRTGADRPFAIRSLPGWGH